MKSFLLLITLTSLFDAAGGLFAKFWVLKNSPLYLVGTTVCFALAGLCFAYSLKFEGLAIANIIWIGLAIIFVVIVSHFVFHENISHLQWLGIIVISIGLVMVNVKSS